MSLLALAACGSLPDDGPSAKVVEKGAAAPARSAYSIVNLDYRVTQIINSSPQIVVAGLSGADSDAPTDLISDGDALSVQIFESGAAPLFGRQSLGAGAQSAMGLTTQSESAIPRLVVDRDGQISIPYAGRVLVRGLTPAQAEGAIREALRGRAVDPQVIVGVLTSPQNAVSVIGEVRMPGRYPVSANSDRLLDVIAAAGGPTKPYADVNVVLVRGDHSITAPLWLLMHDPAQNVRLAPHDQVRLILHERKFSIMGGFGHVSENPLTVEHATLASVISANGGLDTYSADNSAVFIFRFEREDIARALGATAEATPKGVPVVYRLDMRDPNGFFYAGNFEVQPEDIVYVPRASSIGVKKFLDLVSVVTSVTYTAAVTSANVP